MVQYLTKLFLGIFIVGFYVLLMNYSTEGDYISYWLPAWLNVLYIAGSGFIAVALASLFNPNTRDKVLTATLKPGYAEFANPIFPYTSLIFGLTLCYFLYEAGWSQTLGSVLYYVVVSQMWNTSIRVFARG